MRVLNFRTLKYSCEFQNPAQYTDRNIRMRVLTFSRDSRPASIRESPFPVISSRLSCAPKGIPSDHSARDSGGLPTGGLQRPRTFRPPGEGDGRPAFLQASGFLAAALLKACKITARGPLARRAARSTPQW